MPGSSSNDELRQQVGVLAQELRQVLPDAVHETVSCICNHFVITIIWHAGFELHHIYMFFTSVYIVIEHRCSIGRWKQSFKTARY